MKITKRLLSIFLALLMIFGSAECSLYVFAEDDTDESVVTEEFSKKHLNAENSSILPNEESDSVTGKAPEQFKSYIINKPDISALKPFESVIEKTTFADNITYIPTSSLPKSSSYASYNGSVAAAYAIQYAKTYNSQYKKLESDCTNFVSQAIATGGVYSYINTSFTSEPDLLKNYIVDSNSNSWYMVKKKTSLGRSYWAYSKSWANVNDFRKFHMSHSASGSNTFFGALSGGTPNQTKNESTNFEYKLRKNAKVGQVWQLANHHSIIITSVQKKTDGYNYVWYCAHSESAQTQDIQVFLNWCYKNYRTTTIYSMSFS